MSEAESAALLAPSAQDIDSIMARMDAAYAATRAAGYPSEGPECDALAAVYADLRDWKAALRG